MTDVKKIKKIREVLGCGLRSAYLALKEHDDILDAIRMAKQLEDKKYIVTFKVGDIDYRYDYRDSYINEEGYRVWLVEITGHKCRFIFKRPMTHNEIQNLIQENEGVCTPHGDEESGP